MKGRDVASWILMGRLTPMLMLAAAPLWAIGPAPVPQAGEEVAVETRAVWTCPVHREVTESEAGKCQICDRDLIETLVQEAWSCPLHAVISEREPGTCPICGRDLYLVTEEVFFACPMHPEERQSRGGTCPICNMALERTTSTRPHQDHNPKHGGLFFMAPDNWHHLEGLYPEDGVFRVYFYDNFSAPMKAGDFEGRAVLKEVFDTESRETREILAYPLRASPDGAYLEADVGSQPLPREITAKIRFARGDEFERFDFIFADFSAESLADETEVAAGDASRLDIPASPEDIAFEISLRDMRVRRLVSKGAFAEIYVPALEGKDLALALSASPGQIAIERQGRLEWALKQLIRSAWLLDDAGDLGNREMVSSAYDLYREAVEEILAIYEVSP